MRRLLSRMLWPALAWTCVLAAGRAGAQTSLQGGFTGPFELRQALSLYLVNHSGVAFTITVKSHDPLRAQMERPVLIRVFDPDERLLLRRELPGLCDAGIEESAKLHVPASGAGVYQVAITGFDATIDFSTQPPLAFGVFGSPTLACRGDQFAQAYVYLPPTLESLTVRAGEAIRSVEVIDAVGTRQLTLAGSGEGRAAVPAAGDEVWRLSAIAEGVGTLNFAGIPVVLCPDESTARAIHASVDILDDGTLCFHKFQVRAHALMKKYRRLPPEALRVRTPVLIRQKAAWLVEPQRNQLLLGAYGVLSTADAALAEQNIDPSSPWFGAITVWRDERGQPRRDDPWRRVNRLQLNRVAETLPTLAAAYSIRERFNPLGGDPALLRRIIIAALADLMLIREHELAEPEYTAYQGGGRAFVFPTWTLPLSLVAEDLPADVRAVWTEGLTRMVDHESISHVGVTCNQWSFIIRGIQQFSECVDDRHFKAVVDRHLRWMLTRTQGGWGQMPAGYFAESGPDATYVGITLHNLAYVYERTRDASLLQALQRCLDLFNHTVASEPDGSWLGATSFCARTPDDWSMPQFGGGIGMLADDLVEAAPLYGRAWMTGTPPRNATELRDAEHALTNQLQPLGVEAFRKLGPQVRGHASDIAFLVWRQYASAPLAGALPSESQEPFTRAFGDEFMCVRRAGYYALVYAGRPMEQWQKAQRVTDALKQYPRNGGGLCMFWTPRMGSSILGRNWSAFASNTIIAVAADGRADWEDYWSVESSFDIDRAEAKVSSALLNHPVTIERRMRFLEDAVHGTVRLDGQPVADATLQECFPYPLDKPRPLSVTLLDAEGRPAVNRPASAVLMSDNGGEAHLLVFDKPRACDVLQLQCIDNYGKQRTFGRVLTRLERATSKEFEWLLTSVPAAQAAARVREMVSRLNAE